MFTQAWISNWQLLSVIHSTEICSQFVASMNDYHLNDLKFLNILASSFQWVDFWVGFCLRCGKLDECVAFLTRDKYMFWHDICFRFVNACRSLNVCGFIADFLFVCVCLFILCRKWNHCRIKCAIENVHSCKKKKNKSIKR